jgi:hypothetical protein
LQTPSASAGRELERPTGQYRACRGIRLRFFLPTWRADRCRPNWEADPNRPVWREGGSRGVPAALLNNVGHLVRQ